MTHEHASISEMLSQIVKAITSESTWEYRATQTSDPPDHPPRTQAASYALMGISTGQRDTSYTSSWECVGVTMNNSCVAQGGLATWAWHWKRRAPKGAP